MANLPSNHPLRKPKRMDYTKPYCEGCKMAFDTWSQKRRHDCPMKENGHGRRG